MMNVLNLATNGLIDDMTPLSIAVAGHITIQTPDDVVVVVPPFVGGGGGYDATYRTRIKERIEDTERTVHKDDDEILEILVQIITQGVLN